MNYYDDRYEHHENRLNNRRNPVRCHGCGHFETESRMTHVDNRVYCSGKGCQQKAQDVRDAQLAQKRLWMQHNGYGSNVVTLNPAIKAA